MPPIQDTPRIQVVFEMLPHELEALERLHTALGSLFTKRGPDHPDAYVLATNVGTIGDILQAARVGTPYEPDAPPLDLELDPIGVGPNGTRHGFGE